MSQPVELDGSTRTAPAGAEPIGPVDAGTPVSVTVYVRPNPGAAPPFDVAEEAAKDPRDRRYLTHAEAAAVYGATAADIAAVTAFASEYGLDVTRTNPAARSVKLAGTAESIGRAFGVELQRFTAGGITYRSHTGPVHVPAELAGVVQAVIGLDDQPLGRNFLRRASDELQAAIRATQEHHRRHKPTKPTGPSGPSGPTDPSGPTGTAPALPANTYYPPTVAGLYDFPTEKATGQTVGIFTFNGPIGEGQSAPGGYETSILQSYFSEDLGLTFPAITDVVVQGPGNDPGDGSNPNDASPEVYLDLSIVGSLATGATIVMYFTEFTEQGWVDALTEATTDTTNDPDVISISYGNPESGTGTIWAAAAVQQVETALESAASRGVTITVAAGDSGASDGETTGVHVDFPASSPWVLACGGTRLEASGSTISSEVVWNDQSTDASENNGATGGGVSVVFPPPTWQANADVPPVAGGTTKGRGVPDVSSLADPQTPFVVAQPGGPAGVGGTSAAAPLWASLLARCNTALGTRVGFVNPVLYTLPAGTLRDITQGNNKMPPNGPGYDAGPGWDACTGLGSPGGSALLTALTSATAAATA